MSETQPKSPDAPVSGGFIYENEHPMLPIPFSARVGDRRVEGNAISITQAQVSGLMPPNMDTQKNPVALQFHFEGFSVNLFLEANVIKTGAVDSPELTLQFCDPTGSHLAPLRYIMNSYLAGDIVTVGRFLGFTGPTQEKPKALTAKPGFTQRVGRTMRQSAIIALSLGILAVAANVVRERVLFSYEARPIVISQSGETLRATSAGQITYVNEAAGAGDVAYSIGANSGDLLSVRMPCDCTMLPSENFYEGATVLAGAPLVKLISAESEIEANTQISFDGAALLLAGDVAELELSGGLIVPVNINIAESTNDVRVNDTIAAQITIDPDTAEQLTIGDTARLRFRRQILPNSVANLFDSSL
ncbi:hypothetical protein DS901_12655 [Loktanella sp. D2R18]|uniref:hypothetical protein n=1 Tax=Rhodobacterales TaxID=204455 RepID=UPI000DEBFA81|nr:MULTISPECIES: hypothetical protein [Rhodobacterales]MDO6591920.1 hypothetical protein [Yoonia sp. 1_MG-2023]RBW42648.1 hypothetical protein DS901_12655 [Loktanella sp. D2R18]